MKSLPDWLVMGCGVLALLAGAVFCVATTTVGKAVLPAEQTSWENLQPIQPKGYDAQDDKDWMEGDKALAEGNYWNAMATKTIAEAPVGINPNNDGSAGVGFIFGAIAVVFLLGMFILSIGKK